MTTETINVEKIIQAIDTVWQQIAHDIPENEVSAYEMAETSLDANRLETFGFPNEQKAFSEMVMAFGYDNVMKQIVSKLPYAHYEAGGACEQF